MAGPGGGGNNQRHHDDDRYNPQQRLYLGRAGVPVLSACTQMHGKSPVDGVTTVIWCGNRHDDRLFLRMGPAGPGHALAAIQAFGMNLSTLLLEREAANRPVTVGLLGAGKFGTMFLSQARLTKGLHGVAVADLNVERAKHQLATAGWPAAQFAASSLDDALKKRATHITADAEAVIGHPGIEVIVEATGI